MANGYWLPLLTVLAPTLERTPQWVWCYENLSQLLVKKFLLVLGARRTEDTLQIAFTGDQRQFHLYAATRQAYSFITLFKKNNKPDGPGVPLCQGDITTIKAKSTTDQCIRTFKTLSFTEVLPNFIITACLALVIRVSDGTLNSEKVPHANSSSCFLILSRYCCWSF